MIFFSPSPTICRSLLCLIAIVLLTIRVLLFPATDNNISRHIPPPQNPIRTHRYLEIPQLTWGFNNQKIALARACLTARFLNRTLLMPSLSSSLFYKDLRLLRPISFHRVFDFRTFNSLCHGFSSISPPSSSISNSSFAQLHKGSGRSWTAQRDMEQLLNFTNPPFHDHQLLKITGTNPFLWHDHWPLSDYSRIFDCLVVVDEISNVADMVESKIREVGRRKSSDHLNFTFMAVHMRVERDWMLHCKNLERRLKTTLICSSRGEIVNRCGNITGLKRPVVAYLAVADGLLDDGLGSVSEGWGEGMVPLEKKMLGVDGVFAKLSYLFQSAVDYEVCRRADIFVGNSFSTFSGLVVLERTQRMLREVGEVGRCGRGFVVGTSYAYNILGGSRGPKRWATNMNDSSLRAISYGTSNVSC